MVFLTFDNICFIKKCQHIAHLYITNFLLFNSPNIGFLTFEVREQRSEC